MDRTSCIWDWLPELWTKELRYYDPEEWYHTDAMRSIHVEEEFKRVTSEFDRLLAAHGYEREGLYYRAVRPNRDTIVLFCHFGVECVLLSHLMHVSPMPLWHGLCAAPSSVTTIYTEERRQGIASFPLRPGSVKPGTIKKSGMTEHAAHCYKFSSRLQIATRC